MLTRDADKHAGLFETNRTLEIAARRPGGVLKDNCLPFAESDDKFRS